ncbi:MAG: InlB B-repeat-containing protein [Planctomycetota bacterium]|jgi:hypothetical protein
MLPKKLICLMVFVVLLGLVAAPALAADYYLDAVDGNDTTGDGSLGNPWKSFKNIMSYYGVTPPAGWANIAPGDTIYMMDGVYSEAYDTHNWETGDRVVFFKNEGGDSANVYHIKAYPGHNPVIDPQGGGVGIQLQGCDWWEIEGVEVRNAYGRGILVQGGHATIHDVHIHDTNGVDNNNIAGLEVNGSPGFELYDSILNDNYDRICTDTGGNATENSANVVFFSNSGDIIIHDCEFYQSLPLSDPKSGGGVKYKHASQDPDSTFQVYNCTFTNHKFFAFGSGTTNTHFHHNIINGGATISSRDFGGTTHQTNQVFEYNTIYGGKGLAFNPTNNWVNVDFPDDPCNIVFRNNIVYDTASSYSSERGIVDIGCYMTDVLYFLTLPELHFGRNCYYNPNIAAQFNIAAGFNYKPDYAEGGQYNLADWRSTYGYDVTSIETDPLFVDAGNGDFRLQPCSPCAGMGVYAGDFDDSNTIDWDDVNVMTEHWLDTGSCVEGDLNNDDIVNFPDFAEFGRVWAIAYISDPNYLLTVNSGSGDGLYKENEAVPISADVIGGMIFAEWTGDTAGIANIYAANTTLTMPASNVTITATYIPIPTYLLTVNNGSGGGSYEEGQVVAIAADTAPPGEEFSHWAGDTAGIDDIFQASTTITMPAQAVTITAMYKDLGTVFVTEEFGDAVDTNYPGTVEDTYTNAGSSTGNFSTDVTLNTYTWPADTVANTTIIKWDLSMLPTDTVIAEATLYLYQVDSRGDVTYDVGVHKIINVDPNITTCTWNTYNGVNSWTGGANGGQGDIASAEDIPAVNNTDNEYKAWRVTNMVQDWVLVPANNFGMLVNSDDTALVDHYRFFASTEDAVSAVRPKLIITYVASGS